MPRRSKGARLQLKAARRDERGNITQRATWIIRGNGRDISTGCTADEIAAAEEKLRDYIAAKYTPKRRFNDAAEKIAMRERKAHVSGAVSGAVISLRPIKS